MDRTEETGAPKGPSYREAKLEPATLELRDAPVIGYSAGRWPFTDVRIQGVRTELIERNGAEVLLIMFEKDHG